MNIVLSYVQIKSPVMVLMIDALLTLFRPRLG